MKTIGNKCQVIKIGKESLIGNLKINQDTAKEDYLLCPDCEKKIEKYETKVANTFYKKRNDSKTYEKKQFGNNYECRKYKGLDYKTFKIFCYSLLYRASIATEQSFIETKLPKSYEEHLANQILNKEEFNDIPIYAFILSGNYDHTRNILGIRPYDKQPDIIHIIANDIMIILDLFEKRKSLENYKSFCSNKNEILFCEVSPREWEKWINSIKYKLEIQIKFNKIGEIINFLINKNLTNKDK